MAPPDVRCLVGWILPNGEVIIRRQFVLLEDAADYHSFGWIVLVDPEDHDALLAYERSIRPWNQPRFKGPPCNGE